ncbi:hypothetical protein [Rhodococcus sp. IEGM 1307]|uniref:hypothetical protein n=1 Tax=Rhodococcus sp. IEGM 1307 TaxID=3047091 RepID=UPI0024B8756A|nr:hypothetical protein [Rhodococcus sp. IEGM 1307]MDI9980126.1 hypothetical protein [Rhodococcus sp. IEGM 1307]
MPHDYAESVSFLFGIRHRMGYWRRCSSEIPSRAGLSARLGSHSRKYRPYRAFRALGLVTRTLLRYLSEPKLREQNTANRADAIRCFADSLGGKLIGHNDPDYLEKMIKFSNRSPPSEPGSLS